MYFHCEQVEENIRTVGLVVSIFCGETIKVGNSCASRLTGKWTANESRRLDSRDPIKGVTRYREIARHISEMMFEIDERAIQYFKE
jgi:hypothetical protein